jgi:hypothetical protein
MTKRDVRRAEHKRKLHAALTQDFKVIASIGDSLEEEQAAAEVGIPFVKVDPCRPEDAWDKLGDRIAEVGCFKPGDAE